MHAPTGTVIEVDDAKHFTSFRLAALELYPFDVSEQMALCREWAPRTDGLDRGLAAKGFGFGGVGRERAYRDALFDLAVPAMGHPPVVRISAPDGDGAAAYRPPPRRAHRIRIGEPLMSVIATLTVRQRPQRMRTLSVICSWLIDSASTLPHSAQT